MLGMQSAATFGQLLQPYGANDCADYTACSQLALACWLGMGSTDHSASAQEYPQHTASQCSPKMPGALRLLGSAMLIVRA